MGTFQADSVSPATIPRAASAAQATQTTAATTRNAQACTNFYQFVNAAWLAATPLSSEEDVVDNLAGIAARNQQALLEALRVDARQADEGSTLASQRALVRLYQSLLDRQSVERLGLAPLAAEFAWIDGLGHGLSLPTVLGKLTRRGVLLPVRLQVVPFDDPKADVPSATDALHSVLERRSPARVVSVQATPTMLEQFQQHAARMFELLGESTDQAKRSAQWATAMEQRLLQIREHPAEVGFFDFAALRESAGVPAALPARNDALAAWAMTRLQADFDSAAWRAFLRWRLVNSFIEYLPAKFRDERARWENGPRPERTVPSDGTPLHPHIAALGDLAPDLLDAYFVQRVMPADAATQTQEMVQSLRNALHANIATRPWMSAQTREASQQTLRTMRIHVPVLLPASPATTVARSFEAGTLLANALLAAQTDFDRRMALALSSTTGQDTHGSAWWQNEPHYNPLSHSVIVSPVLVQVMLAQNAGLARRYGALGSLLAHEMLHAFDVPADLLLSPLAKNRWLSEADVPYVDAQARRAAQVYAAWTREYRGTDPVQPRFMGEDISDLGSIPLAYAALKQAHPEAADSEFFEGFATANRQQQSRTFDVDHIQRAAHAIPTYRVNGPLANFPPFAATYGCTASDPMVRDNSQRVALW